MDCQPGPGAKASSCSSKHSSLSDSSGKLLLSRSSAFSPTKTEAAKKASLLSAKSCSKRAPFDKAWVDSVIR
jgi:hypothetical protein